MANHYAVFTLRDHGGERSSVKIYNGVITAGTLPAYLTQLGALRTALDGITLGTIEKEMWVGDATLLSSALPADANAQRETKWLVRYFDTVTNKKYTFEIPTALLTGQLVANTGIADLTTTEMAAFVTAFEAIARCPDSDVNAVEISQIIHVGRNL